MPATSAIVPIGFGPTRVLPTVVLDFGSGLSRPGVSPATGIEAFLLEDQFGNRYSLQALRQGGPPPEINMRAARSPGSERIWYEGDGRTEPEPYRLTGPYGDLAPSGYDHEIELNGLASALLTATRLIYNANGIEYYLPIDTEAPRRGYFRRLEAPHRGRYSTLEVVVAVTTRSWRRTSDDVDVGPII